MHETAIIESALAIVLATAQEHHLSKVKTITARVGVLSGALPEALLFAFDVLSKGTIAEGAQFHIERVPATARCVSCNITFAIDNFNKLCPQCQTFSHHVVSGYELSLNMIEGE